MTQTTPPETPEPTPERPVGTPAPQAGMPKWLIYGFAVKLALVVVITVGVMWWAGVFG